MAEKRQTFRFRLPWLTAAPAVPRPNQAAQTASQQATAQRPPFRPAGVAPAQPAPRAEPQPPSQSRATSQPTAQSRGPTPSRAPQASPTRAAPQTQVSSQAASPARRVSPQPQPARPKASAAPPPTPSEAKPSSSPKKSPATLEIPQPPKEPMKEETLQPPLQEAEPLAVTTASQEKVVESFEGQKTQPDIGVPKPKASNELAIGVSGPKPEVYQTPSEEHTRMLRGMNHDEPKEKKVTDTHVSALKQEPKWHPLSLLDERSQHPSEEVFDRKEVLETFKTGGHHTETHIDGNEKGGGFSNKTALAGEKPTLHKEMKAGSSKIVHKLGRGQDRHPLPEKPFSIITLTGENTGATMHLSSEPLQKERSIHIHRAYKINPDESVETTSEGEGSSGGRKSGDSRLQKELATKRYVNNNAQGINNSLVFNSSVTERNPGVHVVLSRNSAEPLKPRKERETFQTRKAEVGSTPAERLAYAPTIRRRCLRGLFMESSDSDPEKPRRHGCRVGCNQKSKDDRINVL